MCVFQGFWRVSLGHAKTPCGRHEPLFRVSWPLQKKFCFRAPVQSAATTCCRGAVCKGDLPLAQIFFLILNKIGTFSEPYFSKFCVYFLDLNKPKTKILWRSAATTRLRGGVCKRISPLHGFSFGILGNIGTFSEPFFQNFVCISWIKIKPKTTILLSHWPLIDALWPLRCEMLSGRCEMLSGRCEMTLWLL